MKIKRCSLCLSYKKIDKFYLNKKYRHGVSWRCKSCCHYSTLASRFGVNRQLFLDILRRQKYLCAICGNKEPLNSRLCVDHNHTSGKVRGLLCTNCNLLLGNAKDSIWILLKSVMYLIGK